MIQRDEAYKIAFETWRFQVNSYWTRNSYFAVFEAAAVAGVWKLTDGHGITAALFSALAGVLTWIWASNNRRSHEYVRFWWEKIVCLEQPAPADATAVQDDPARLASGFDTWRDKYRKQPNKDGFGYSKLIRLVPWLFGIGWLYLVIYNVRNVLMYVRATHHW